VFLSLGDGVVENCLNKIISLKHKSFVFIVKFNSYDKNCLGKLCSLLNSKQNPFYEIFCAINSF
jgi:hypothetical protein